MPPELKAAADRYRAHLTAIGSGWAKEAYSKSPYFIDRLASWGWDETALRIDQALLAEAFINDHPEIVR